MAFLAALSSASEQNVWSETVAQHLGAAAKIYCFNPFYITFLSETSLILAIVLLF